MSGQIGRVPSRELITEDCREVASIVFPPIAFRLDRMFPAITETAARRLTCQSKLAYVDDDTTRTRTAPELRDVL